MARNTSNRKNTLLGKLDAEYKAIVPTASSFCDELSKQIIYLLRQESIALGFPIQYRVKSWASISEKIDRLSFNAKKITDLQDLVGLRIILLFRRDVRKVISILSQHFKIIKEYDTQERLKTDQFGYSSVHLILELPESWLNVPTIAPMRGLRAEIQVRTVAQHIWAEASQNLQYKKEESVPPPILRAIHRASALLETIDLEFERVLEQRDSYRAEISLTENTSRLTDVDVLEKILDEFLPAANKTDDEEYSEILMELIHFKLDTQDKLIDLIQQNLHAALDEDAYHAKKNLEEHDFLSNTPERAEKGIFFNHSGLVRTMLGRAFGQMYLDFQMDRYHEEQRSWQEEE
jgi:putative GTP pyrophosphokinase